MKKSGMYSWLVVIFLISMTLNDSPRRIEYIDVNRRRVLKEMKLNDYCQWKLPDHNNFLLVLLNTEGTQKHKNTFKNLF